MGNADLWTLVGTLATLALIIANLVVTVVSNRAVRRDARSTAITGMRQRWIDELRDAAATLLARAREVHSATQGSVLVPKAAADLVAQLDYVTLKLNPTEPPAEMMRLVLARLVQAAGAYDQLRGTSGYAMAGTDFDLVARWATLLSQLVLKVEWVRVSGPDTNGARTRDLVATLVAFERGHRAELAATCGQAMAYRRARAPLDDGVIAPWWTRAPYWATPARR